MTCSKRLFLRENIFIPMKLLNIGGLNQRKFYKFLTEGTYDFIAYYGKRKLILREKFERYIWKNHDIWEALKRRGKKRRCTEG